MLHFFKQRKDRKAQAKSFYNQAVAQARLPIFYTDFGVPDTIDGRFELIALHNYILIHRLSWNGQIKMSQALFDAFFVNMERSLREMGIGDLAVPKHMKRMMQGFNGRCQSYEAAIKTKDTVQLNEAIARNVYGTLDKADANKITVQVKALANYVERSIALENEGEIKDAQFAVIETAAAKLSA